MIKISATVIAFNEEKNIARCIDSLKTVADEIIVADSFSTDKTKEIALEREVEFFEKNWEGYGQNKNFAAARTTHRYVLNIDADEALSDELIASILAAKKTGLNGVYEFNRLTNYCGKWIYHCGWYPDRKIRLYPKDLVEWNHRIIHEELIFKKQLPVTFLKGNLHHYSYYTTRQHWAKATQYAHMGAKRDIDLKNNFLIVRSTLGAVIKFIKMYFLQLGVLDGKPGFVICWISAYASWKKYRFKRELLDNERKESN